METFKEKESFEVVRGAILDNGVQILIFGSRALGSDGNNYYEITEVKTYYDEFYGFEDEEYTSLGWSCDIDGPRIIRE